MPDEPGGQIVGAKTCRLDHHDQCNFTASELKTKQCPAYPLLKLFM